MKSHRLLALSAGLVLAGCAAFEGPIDSTAEEDASRGISAAERGEYEVAYARLTAAYADGLEGSTRRNASLALAAVDLDPRNAARRPERATPRLARLLASPRFATDPLRPAIEVLYLLALETGAPPFVVDSGARAPPRLPDPSLAVRLARAERQRDSLRDALGAAERELARIRKLLEH